ncbi:hypothetical protein H7K45_27855 [Mycobacterium yunnanensis]|uniref:Uncharacterized protein n=1 Tax=Mycobacterium yunnanensis TaxID=368477 RepID=A0A9X2Z8W5_9MYCO|nr:hypothetical protein [Mycobacterium yunnanensis]MCV7424366.1 hypothetical protein [Mycobacterium yunnanensis]
MSTREYAKNLFSTWSDDDFCAQPIFDKLLFQVLNGQRTVNTAGVFPINYTRMRKAMRDGDTQPTEQQLRDALARLEGRRYVFIDETTGEGLIRSRVRRDELEKQPTVLLAALRMMAAFDSPKFAAVMLTELGRIALPVITSNSDKANALRNNLKRAWDDAHAHLRTLSEGFQQPSVLDPLETLSRPSPEGHDDQGKHQPTETLSRPSPDPLVSVSGSVSVSTSRNAVGHLGGQRDTTPDQTTPPGPDDEPPEYCPKHMPHGDPDTNCGPCGGYRRLHTKWVRRQPDRDAAATHTATRQAQARAHAIANCTCCDTEGWTLDDDGLVTEPATRCTHQPPNDPHA